MEEASVSDPKVIRILCPNLSCRSVLAVPDNARGKVVKCRTCGIKVRVPGGGEATTPAA
jgi:ribosomal protein S27E